MLFHWAHIIVNYIIWIYCFWSNEIFEKLFSSKNDSTNYPIRMYQFQIINTMDFDAVFFQQFWCGVNSMALFSKHSVLWRRFQLIDFSFSFRNAEILKQRIFIFKKNLSSTWFFSSYIYYFLNRGKPMSWPEVQEWWLEGEWDCVERYNGKPEVCGQRGALWPSIWKIRD